MTLDLFSPEPQANLLPFDFNGRAKCKIFGLFFSKFGMAT